MKNEIMNAEEIIEMNEEAITGEGMGFGALKSVAIVAGIVGAGYVLYKLGKKAYTKYAAKKEQEAAEHDFITTDE